MFRKAEEELRRTLHILSDIQVALNQSSVVLMTDSEGFIVYANEMAHTKIDLLENMEDRLTFVDLLEPNQTETVDDLWKRLGTGETWSGAFQIVSLDNDRNLCLQTTAVPFLTEDGVPYQHIFISFDITAQREAELAQKEREDQLKGLINALPEAVLFRDAEGRCLEANEYMLSSLDMKDVEWQGKTIADIKSNVPSYVKVWDKYCKDALSQGGTLHYQDVRRVRRKAKHVEGSAVPFFNDDGSKRGVMLIERDVTELKASQGELLETKGELESIIENSADAISVTSLTGRMLKVNPSFERMYGWSAREVIGNKFPFFEKLEILSWIEEVKQGKSISGVETVRKRRDGINVHINITLFPVHGRNGRVIAVAAVSRDITAVVKSKELLHETDKLTLVGQMAAGIVHEIRNPLTSLQGFTQLIQESEGFSQRDYTRIMLDEFHRIDKILAEMLSLAKPKKHVNQNIDIGSIITDVVSLLRTQAHEKSVILNPDVSRHSLVVKGSQDELKQVLINIVKNAIEATPSGGEISLSGVPSQSGDTVVVRCRDQGTGIAKEHLKRLGDPFFSTKTNGTGLGLMVTKQIVQSHCGKFNIQSEEGKGTTVTLEVPRIYIETCPQVV